MPFREWEAHFTFFQISTFFASKVLTFSFLFANPFLPDIGFQRLTAASPRR